MGKTLFTLMGSIIFALSIQGRAAALEVGAKMPDVTLTDLQGRPVKLQALKGKVVVLDFWASWCGPCKEAMPALDKIYKKYKDKGLVIIGVSVDREKDKINGFLQGTPVSFGVAHDEGHKLADMVKPPKMPSSYVFGRDLSLKHIHDGYHAGDEAKFDREIGVLIAEKGAEDAAPAMMAAPAGGDDAKADVGKGKKKRKGKK